MARPDIAKLYQRLVDTRFDFIPRGEHALDNVYRLVKAKYPRFCDDNYLCSENCSSIHQQPEWKHTVRSALNNLKVAFGVVFRGSHRGHWQFLRAAELRAIRDRDNKLKTKVKRPSSCTKCGENSFGTWTSSSTGIVHFYCTICRDERRVNYVKRKIANGGTHTKAEWLKKLGKVTKCPGCKRYWEDTQMLARILTERCARWEAKQLAKFEEQGKAPPKDWNPYSSNSITHDGKNALDSLAMNGEMSILCSGIPEKYTRAQVEQMLKVG